MDFNKIPQILSLVMSSLSSRGLKTDDFYFVLSYFFFLFWLWMVYLYLFLEQK